MKDPKTSVSFLTTYPPFRKTLAQQPALVSTVLSHFLDNIKAHSSLNAFTRVYEEEAQARATQLEKALHQQSAGALAGMVVGIKELLCYKNHPVNASSNILKGFVSQISATAVDRLTQAGSIIIGHQNCDEFGMGSANEYSAHGPVSNPINPERVAGGSSGGSAAATAAHMCHLSLGTDTGGSVRQPASFCGLIGLKPTYGRISRYGLIAYASSFDTIGILAHDIPTCAAALEVIAGADKRDSTTAPVPVPAYTQWLRSTPPDQKTKVCFLKETLSHPALQPEIKKAFQQLFQQLQRGGHEVTGTHFSLLDYALPVYYVLTTAEARSNLARYDGVRYGLRATSASSFQEMICNTRSEGFGKEVKRRLLLGSFVLSSNYHDAYYLRAQKVRRRIKETLEAILDRYEFILGPTTPTTAFPHGSTQNQDAPTQYLADLYTVPASIAGLPAISIPIGVDREGLPIGLQIIGKAFQEEKLLAFAHNILQHIVAHKP